MRLLHVSDWHLGATLGRLSREEDHVVALEAIKDVAGDFEPHLVVHTGDLFDVVRPGVGSMRLAFDALHALAARCPVVVVAGNHDSRPLFRLFNQILGSARDDHGITFVADLDDVLEFPGEGDEVARLAAMPFLHPNAIVDAFETPPPGWTGQYADGVRELQNMLREGLDAGYVPTRHINLYAAHLHVGGAVLAHSERVVHVSQDYAVDAESVPPVSYAAFGHIHKPQRLPGLVTGRYAGSPIQMDYGERNEEKSIVAVDVQPASTARVEVVPIDCGRRLTEVEGTWDELAARASEHSGPEILTATVVSEEAEKDCAARMAELFPQADLLYVFNKIANQQVAAAHTSETAVVETSFRDGFAEYVRSRGDLGKKQGARLIALFDSLLAAVETESEPSLEEETALGVAEGI